MEEEKTELQKQKDKKAEVIKKINDNLSLKHLTTEEDDE